MLTVTEENYLKAIFKQSTPRVETVSTNTIAQAMETTPASVTDMLKKLSTKGLIEYERYKGVRLSPLGSVMATDLVRKHRLWETFLVNKLGFTWEEVHPIAEQLEHIQSDALIDRLDSYLSFPKYDPHGDPIPNAEGKFTLRDQQLLSSSSVGDRATVIGVKRHDTQFLTYLNSLEIGIGTRISIESKNLFDHSMVLVLENKNTCTLSDLACKNLYIKFL